NGFWAQIGNNIPQTAYASAKFAVKGFSEALQTDLRLNAPHVKCSVVMPGHIGTGIAANSRKLQSGNETDTLNAKELRLARARIASMGVDAGKMSDAEIEQIVRERARKFVEEAPMTAAEAAAVILGGVKAERWRILVGKDAHRIDELVRQTPEKAYDIDFFERFASEVGWKIAR
ncbi:MAG: SDR family NAD(P)-dependent oxidoreductase, partial [Rhodospirillales bacterium]|nr:SDR family NAD(P)-dependent oxidoreductase [Rhodospirillales bacterium]